MAQSLSDLEKQTILTERKLLLTPVSEYINNELNPVKTNFLDTSRDDYKEPLSIIDILTLLGISVTDYYNALSISDDNNYQIHLYRPPNSCFVHNYFKAGLLSWEANLDIQPVFNEYKAVAYMCSYLSKSEDTCTQAVRQALDESLENKNSNYEQMRAIAHAYATNRECSVQEAVYHILPELWLRKTFPGVIFENSNTPDRRFKMFRNEKEILELDDESKDVFKRNMLDRYIDRPNSIFANGIYSGLDQFCYAEFLRYYYLAPKPIENDCQPEVLPDEILEINHDALMYPMSIPLMYSKEKLKCRKVPAILRFHSPNKDKDFELYVHHLLFLFYPFRSEIEMKIGEPLSYTNKLAQPGVLEIVNNNKTRIEPFDDIVNEALIRYNVDNLNNLDPYAQAENDETLSLLTSQCSGRDENNVSDFSAPVPVDTIYLHDDDIGVPVPVDTIYLHDDDIGVPVPVDTIYLHDDDIGVPVPVDTIYLHDDDIGVPVPVDTIYLHDDDIGAPVPVDTIYLHDDDIGVLIRSLNHKQRHVFDYIYHWARNVVNIDFP